MAIYTSAHFRIHLQIAGVALDTTPWEKFAGGNLTAENQQHNPGNAAPQIAVGGLRKRGNVTMERAWDDFLIATYLALDNSVGYDGAVCSITPIAPGGKSTTGAPIVYSGVVESVTRPDGDSTSSTVAMLSVILTMNETIN